MVVVESGCIETSGYNQYIKQNLLSVAFDKKQVCTEHFGHEWWTD